jgi:hypothetical protein
MKTHLLLAALISFAAIAQDIDPVAEQIRLTQDSVRVALNEIENGSEMSISSVDGDAKLARLRTESAAALRTFEERVRLRILMPMQILVSQYNQTYRNSSLERDAKILILRNLKLQLSEMALAREPDYFLEVARLHSPLGDLPVAMLTGWGEGSMAMKEVYGSQGNVLRTWGTGFFVSLRNEGNRSHDAAKAYGAGFSAELTREVARSCYTSTCFFQTLNQHVMWASLVSTSITRDLNIQLLDGDEIKISPNYEGEGFLHKRYIIATSILTQVNASSIVLNLPQDIREDRVASLRRLEAALNVATYRERDCKRAVRPIKESLCRSNGGCLTSAEQALIVDRLVASTRSLCLN